MDDSPRWTGTARAAALATAAAAALALGDISRSPSIANATSASISFAFTATASESFEDDEDADEDADDDVDAVPYIFDVRDDIHASAGVYVSGSNGKCDSSPASAAATTFVFFTSSIVSSRCSGASTGWCMPPPWYFHRAARSRGVRSTVHSVVSGGGGANGGLCGGSRMSQTSVLVQSSRWTATVVFALALWRRSHAGQSPACWRRVSDIVRWVGGSGRGRKGSSTTKRRAITGRSWPGSSVERKSLTGEAACWRWMGEAGMDGAGA